MGRSKYEVTGMNRYLESNSVTDWRNVTRSKAFMECIRYFDTTDNETRSILLSINEADQAMVMQGLATKLYGYIVSKVDQIDFGTIPLSKGDVTKVEHYNQLLDCLNILGQILKNYRQPLDDLDTINIALQNIQDRTELWKKGFRMGVGTVMIVYNTMVLSVFCATSLMIASHIEFIKTGDNAGYEIAFDKTSKIRTKDKLLHQSLNDFNNACSKNELDKTLQQAIVNGAAKKESAGNGEWLSYKGDLFIESNPQVIAGYAIAAGKPLREALELSFKRYPSMRRFYEAHPFSESPQEMRLLKEKGMILLGNLNEDTRQIVVEQESDYKGFIASLEQEITNTHLGQLDKQLLSTGCILVQSEANLFDQYLEKINESVTIRTGLIMESTEEIQPIAEGIISNLAAAAFAPGEYLLKGVAAGAVTVGGWLAGHPIIAGIGAFVLGIILIIKIIRNAIFYFYQARVKISDWADTQASLLYMNALNVQNDLTKDEKTRKEIAAKHKRLADQFHKIADKIRVADTAAEVNANKEIATMDNQRLTVGDLQVATPSGNSSLF